MFSRFSFFLQHFPFFSSPYLSFSFMKRILPLCLFLAAPLSSMAEGGLWLEAGAEKTLNKKWSVEMSLGHRQENNLAQSTRWNGALAVNYKVMSGLKLTAGYQYIHDYKDEEGKINYTKKGNINGYNVDAAFWRPRHRLHLDATYKWKPNKRWAFSLRERYQFTQNMEATTTEWKYRDAAAQGQYSYQGERFERLTSEPELKKASAKHYLRSRFKAEYNIKGCPLTPFATYEIANNLAESFDIVRHRFTLGSEWNINKQHTISAAYLHQIGSSDNDNEAPLNILDISYTFKF